MRDRRVALSGPEGAAIAGASRSDERILVTLDLDFANIRAYPPGEHAGIMREARALAKACDDLIKSTIEHMTIKRMEHVGIVVDDLAAAIQFFVTLGLVLQGEGTVEGRWVDRVVGLEGVRADIAMMETPDGNGRLELTKFHSPSIQDGNPHAPANTLGIRHLAFAVEDIDGVIAGLRTLGAELVGELERYENRYRLCYLRGPEGIIIELAEKIG